MFYKALLTLAVLAGTSYADETTPPAPIPEVWGVNELNLATAAALNHVKEEKGEAAYNAIVGYAMNLGIQKNSAKGSVTYVEDGKKVGVAVFCHVHEGEGIDCH